MEEADINRMTALVASIRNAEEPESVTNTMVAELMGLLQTLTLEISDTSTTGLSAAVIRIAKNETDIASARRDINGMLVYIVSSLWRWALGDTYDSENFIYPECGSIKYRLIRNGYFPDADADFPFWLFGKKLSLVQAIKVLLSNWTPMSRPGMNAFEARTHLPCPIYTGMDEATKVDQFNIDMCHVGLSAMESIALRYDRMNFMDSIYSTYTDSEGNEVSGIDINANIPCIWPHSMYRAFDGSVNLWQVLGGIDCRFMDAYAMLYAFRGCKNLNKIRLFNIPDAMTEIDFSWCTQLSPVVLHQLTFWHAGKSYASRPAGVEPLNIYLDEDMWYKDYNDQDGILWGESYATYTVEEWMRTMAGKNVAIHLKNQALTGDKVTEYNAL